MAHDSEHIIGLCTCDSERCHRPDIYSIYYEEIDLNA